MNEHGGSRTSQVGQRVGVLVGVAVAIAVGVWALGDRAADPAVVEATAPPATTSANATTTTAFDEQTLVTAFEPPITPAAPVGSVASDITVTLSNNTDLNDADWITVGGAGFPPNQMLGVVTCLANMAGVEACDVGTVVVLDSDKSGTFTTDYHLSRIIAVGTEHVDCASIDCQLAVGAVSDTSRSGFVTLDFSDGGEIVGQLPTITVQPVDQLVDNSEVSVSGQDFTPGTAMIVQCVQGGGIDDDTGGSSCFSSGIRAQVDVEADGTFTTSWTVNRVVPAIRGDIDCAQPPAGAVCVLIANPDAGFQQQRAPERFTPAVELQFST